MWRENILIVMDFIILFIVYVVLSFIVIPVATSKGRGGCSWFFLSLLISPIIVIIILLALGDTEELKQKRLIEQARIFAHYQNQGQFQNQSQNQSQRYQMPPVPGSQNSGSQKSNLSGKSINDMYRK